MCARIRNTCLDHGVFQIKWVKFPIIAHYVGRIYDGESDSVGTLFGASPRVCDSHVGVGAQRSDTHSDVSVAIASIEDLVLRACGLYPQV